ncbi:MAG: DUF4402 domain-containing protein [Rhodospirillales bacterium]|nr:DUF4402 domain-containing protein [Rhodospirillales bacterium]
MKKQNGLATTLVALSAFVPNPYIVKDALAQATNADTMNITAKIMNPLVVQPSITFSLNFKSFAVSGSGSYAVLPAGTGSISKGVTIGGATAATALVKVPQSVSFTLTIPTFKTNSIFLTIAGGGPPSKVITLKELIFAGKSKIVNATETLNNGNHDITGMRITDPAGSGRFAAGARIYFGANQVVGTYQGSFIVKITL